MIKRLSIAIALTLSISAVSSAVQQQSAPAVPRTTSITAAGCLQEVRDYATKRQQEMMAATAPAVPNATAETTQQLNQSRAPLVSQINQAKTAMAKECASRLDTRTLAPKDLVSLADLYTEAGQNDEVKAAVDRALAVKTLAPAERAAILVYAVRVGLREPVSEARNARLEKYVSELDASTAATMDQKLDAHVQMNGWYRYDDVDAGIIKHSTWIIDAAKKAKPDQRRKFATSAVSAYVNLAQALAGQGQNDRALALLRSAATELADVQPAQRIDPEIARLQLVRTPGAAITAPRWLNMPEGKTELAMPGFVTLLEFSAHWCVPCKESYPGVNRLRQKYGKQGFRVVLSTDYYGYFEQERNLAPPEEFEHDRKYFAEHGMDVPIAVGDRRNNVNYKVGGIPQIHLIDKRGRIRLVMVGYDDANEPRLAKMIEDMLKEN